MKFLVIEDEDDAYDVVRELLDGCPDVAFHLRARSLESARSIIREQPDDFDAVLCDLRIPPRDGSLDLSENHGLAVHAEIAARRPGTPLLFLTARGGPILSDALSEGYVLDLFGENVGVGTVRWIDKDRYVDWKAYIEGLARSFADLSESSFIEGTVVLPDLTVRALKTMARRLGAASVSLRPAGGLSGSETWRAELLNANGAVQASLFVKLDTIENIKQEHANYERFVASTLEVGCYAPVTGLLFGSLRDRAALISRLARPESKSLFDSLSGDAEDQEVVQRLASAMQTWMAQAQASATPLRLLRTERISDERLLAEVDARNLSESFDVEKMMRLESEIVVFQVSSQHGDLHGENVLLCTGAPPVVIDFAAVGESPSVNDPITLELSLVFHGESPLRAISGWPTLRQAESWWDLPSYLEGCPWPDFVRACRDWALRVGSETQIAGFAYAHVLRQLKYPDVPGELVGAFCRGLLPMLEPVVRDNATLD